MDKKCNEISENTPYEKNGIKKKQRIKKFRIGKIVKHFILLSTINARIHKKQS